jgi:hypothetical protein
MAINFPNSPSNGQQTTVGGVRYEYNSSKNAWKKRSIQISAASGSGITVLADMAALIARTGMSDGDQAYVEANNNLYLYDNGWYVVATVTNDSPSAITGVNSSYDLEVDGTATVITAVSTDPEGFPLTWSYSVTSGSLGTTATVSQSGNVFTITPGTNDPADEGTFTLTFSATDGTNVTSASSTFTLAFVVRYAFDSTSSTFANSSLTSIMSASQVSTVTSDWTSKNTVNSQAVYGTNNKVELTIPWSVFDVPTTTEFWVYYDHTGSWWQNLLTFQTNNDTSTYKHHFWGTGGNGQLEIAYGGSYNNPTTPFPWQTWTHVAIVHDRSTGTFAQGYGNRIYYGGNLINYGSAGGWADYSVSGAANTLFTWHGTATTTNITNLRITQDKLYTSNFTPPAQGSY